MATETITRIPVRYISDAELPALIEESRRKIKEYEQRYELLSAEMANLVDQDEIAPSIEMIKWYHTYDELKFLIAKTPMAGIHGTTTKASTTAG